MNVKTQIEEALRNIMPEDEANACHVWKGYDVGTGRNGWHVQRFGRTASFYGANLVDVLEKIDAMADHLSTMGREG